MEKEIIAKARAYIIKQLNGLDRSNVDEVEKEVLQTFDFIKAVYKQPQAIWKTEHDDGNTDHQESEKCHVINSKRTCTRNKCLSKSNKHPTIFA